MLQNSIAESPKSVNTLAQEPPGQSLPGRNTLPCCGKLPLPAPIALNGGLCHPGLQGARDWRFADGVRGSGLYDKNPFKPASYTLRAPSPKTGRWGLSVLTNVVRSVFYDSYKIQRCAALPSGCCPSGNRGSAPPSTGWWSFAANRSRRSASGQWILPGEGFSPRKWRKTVGSGG